MKSHAILRTNPGLTTNAKLVVTSNYDLYLDCIDSSPELNSVRYRKQRIMKDSYLDEVLPKFFRNTPVEVAYKVKYDGDNSTMFKDFGKQFDDLYYYGARNIYDNKDYTEEFEFFAPLHITKSSLPTHFIIFRIDGPGLLELTKDNWRSEYLEKMKVVKVVDLTPSSDLGEFIKKNVTDNPAFPVTSLDIDFKKLEFSYFIGIDYETGGYTRRSQMLENILSKEKPFYEMEKFIFDSFKDNKIVYPHILNFSFLFDDTPATPSSLRKWSINRYCGFYINTLKFETSVSPNDLPRIKPEAVILTGNIIQTPNGDSPFVDDSKIGDFPYIEVGGKYYLIQKYVELGDEVLTRVMTSPYTYADKYVRTKTTKYKILSDISLVGRQAEINNNLINFVTTNSLTALYRKDGLPLQIQNFDDADVWVIEIGDMYHKLIKNTDGLIQLVTDYGFIQSSDKLFYYINESDTSFRKSINLTLSEYQGPIQLKIFKCELSDVKDWDTDIVETDFAKHEYEETEYLTETDEPKFIMTNLNSKSDPKDFDDYQISNKVVNVPVASEYTLNHETFRLIENDLSPLWRKNSVRVKWGFQNSLSDSDYPYLLNNNLLADDFNKTVNPYTSEIKRFEKNLDYFYSINSDSTDYVHQTLHIQPTSQGNLIPTYKFDVFKYLNPNLDYFSYFFGQKTEFGNGSLIKNTQKWSYFNSYDGLITNSTLFRGLKFNIYQVSGISIAENKIENLNLKLTNEFEGYKFSILFSENTTRVEPDTVDLNKGVTQSFINNMRWSIIDQWKMDKVYRPGENVLWNNNFFRCQIENSITDPLRNPYTETIQYSDNETKKANPNSPITDYKWIWVTMFSTQSRVEHAVDSLLQFRQKEHRVINGEAFYLDKFHPFRHIPHLVYYDGEYYQQRNANKAPINNPVEDFARINFWRPKDQLGPNRSAYRNPVDTYFFRDKIWRADAVGGVNSDDLIIRYYNLPGSNDKEVSVNKVDGVDVVSYREFWKEYEPRPAQGANDGDYLQWEKISFWDPNKTYGQYYETNFLVPSNPNLVYDLVVYNNTLYGFTNSSGIVPTIDVGGKPPTQDNRWLRLYSFEPDTNYEYGDTVQKNNTIALNNRFYLYLNDITAPNPIGDQILDKTLDQGIVIYINKIFKNILININVNDNTYKNYVSFNVISPTYSSITSYSVTELDNFMSGINRDQLYNDIFSKLSANNFMNALNDINNKYGFVNSIKYVVLDDNSEIKIYDFNNIDSGKNLPYFISCDGPDEFFVRNNSFKKESINLDENLLKPKFKLQNGTIKSLNELNYVGDTPVANTIEDEKIEQNPIPNFSSLKNNIFTPIYRHSGFYSPIFRNIELFNAFTETKNLGNYKFDTTLTYFGITGERIVSKINRNQNILKLSKVSNQKSIYPIMDEYGYHVVRTFMFKSTWDFKFHFECKIPSTQNNTTNKTLKATNPNRKNSNNF